MHLGRIRHEGPDGPEPRIVVAADDAPDRWVDVRAAERLRLERRGAGARAARRVAAAVAPESMTAALEAGPVFTEAAEAALADGSGDAEAPAGAALLAPIDPPAYRDFMAFEEHFVNAFRVLERPVPDVLYELPASYIGSVHGFVGPEDEVPWPGYTRAMDYELELGIVIGRTVRDIAPDAALDHVLGLTILNDFSARDIQQREMASGLGPSKAKHFASAVGPQIVTLDALDPGRLAMRARVNGETWSEGSSGSMLWPIAEIVAWASTAEWLAAGTLLGSGTVGRGCGFELGRSLSPGDRVELEVEGIGVLANTLGQPTEAWSPEPRRR